MGAHPTQPKRRLGAWLARAHDTIYLAATDGQVQAFFNMGEADDGTLTIDSDGATPPTVDRNKVGTGINDSYANMVYNVVSEVRKGDYWRVTKTSIVSAIVVWWIPTEP